MSTTNRLTISLLGTYQVALNGEPITRFEANSARALLAYLVLEQETVHQRVSLAGLLWPDMPTSAALGNLRQALKRVRQAIGDRKATPPFLHVTRKTIQFNAGGDYWLDVHAFDEGVTAVAKHEHDNLTGCPDCIERLRETADLYRDDFLAQFSLDNSLFETWLLAKQRHYHRQAVTLFQQLVACHVKRSEYELAQHYVERLLELEPWQEEAHRQLMRIMALCGQRSAALAQYRRCAQLLADEFDVEPAAETKVLYDHILTGNVPGAADGYMLQRTLWHESLSLIRNVSASHSLPMPLIPLIGRDAELKEITGILARPDCRLLTLTGMGGIGKTRLALELAIQQEENYKHGVCFVSLSGVQASDMIVPAIANTLNFTFKGRGDILQQLLNYLREKNLLLVLDNMEHLVEKSNFLLDILSAAKDVKILITSRITLNFQPEWLYEVKPLSYPTHDTESDIEEYDAVQLFQFFATQVYPDFSMEIERTAVAKICRYVEGLPLALEILARHTRIYTCSQISEDITRDPGLLQTTRHDLPPRHQSIQVVFEHSWQLLSEEEQKILGRFTVFQDGFDAQAANYVAGTSTIHLAALLDKSWLHRTSSGRYQMHTLLYQYLVTKVAAARQQLEASRNRHCEYYADFLQRRWEGLQAKNQIRVLDEISAEQSNVKSSWDWAVQQGNIDAIGKSCEALSQFYFLHGWFKVGLVLFENATQKLQEMSLDDTGRMILGRVMSLQAKFYLELYQSDKAEPLLQESKKLAQMLNDKRGLALSLKEYAYLYFSSRQLEKSFQISQQYRELVQGIDDKHMLADAYLKLGVLQSRLPAYQEAEEYYYRGLAIAREIGDLNQEARFTSNLGKIYVRQGKDKRLSLQLFGESLHVFEALGAKPSIGFVLINMGATYHELGEYKAAKEVLERSLTLHQDIGDSYMTGISLNGLGKETFALGEYERSYEYLCDALQTFTQLGATVHTLNTFVKLTDYFIQHVDREKAVEILALILDNDACQESGRTRAQAILADIGPELPPDVFESAQRMGRTRALSDLVAEVFARKIGYPIYDDSSHRPKPSRM